MRTAALALAATLLPALSHAATHRAPAKHAAATISHTTAKSSKKHTAKPVRTASPAKKPAHNETVKASSSRRAPTATKAATAVSQKTAAPTRAAASSRVVAAHTPDAVTERTPAHTETKKAVAAVKKQAAAEDNASEMAADAATQDRVHAWYKARAASSEGNKPASGKTETVTNVSSKIAANKSRFVEPDLSPVPRKATAEDFDRAVQVQKQTIRAAQQASLSHTTDDDDAAEAATQIPGTAPTERIAAPFVHGELLAQAADNDATDGSSTTTAKPDRRAKNAQNNAADKIADNAQPASSNGISVRNVAPAMNTASAPKINAPRPVTLSGSSAPAVAQVNAGAKKPVLNPVAAQEITDDALDEEDDAPVKTAKASMLAARTSTAIKTVAEDDYDDLHLAKSPATVKVNLFDNNGRLIMIGPMKGSHEILVHQNQMALADGLDRIEDDGQLNEMRRRKLLMALPDNKAITVNDPLPANRRYARPWTVRFLNDLSRAHYARFHTPLVITSAVRTVEFQRRLVRINGNAAPPTGNVASPHLYGQAIDLGKRGMSTTEVAWMRAYLTSVEKSGKIDVEEEFQQACFHISVYRRYIGLPPRKNTPAATPAPQRRYETVKVTPAPQKGRRHISALLATGVR